MSVLSGDFVSVASGDVVSVLSGGVLDGAFDVPEDTFVPRILPLDEWLTEVLALFSDTLGLILHTPLLRFFAVFGLFCVIIGLCLYLVRTGKALSR